MKRRHRLYHRIGVLLLGLLTLLLSALPGWTAEEATNATTFDNTPSASVTYTGSWTHSSGWSKAYASTVSYSNQVGAKVKLTFSGRYITRVYSMTFNRGSVKVYIDGAQKSAMSDYTSSTRWQVAKTWDAGWSGQHTIEVVNDGGGYIDADAFIVDISFATNGHFDDNHNQFNYIGSWTSSCCWPYAYSSTLHWTNNQESALTFTFTGDSVTVFYTISSNRGTATVTIDGVDRGGINMFGGVTQFKRNTTYNGLGQGIHTIHIANNSGGGFYIDTDILKPGTAYNRAAAINYADAWVSNTTAKRNIQNYPNYGIGEGCNDCTNYLSQVLEAGGIQRIVSLNDDEKTWYVYDDHSGASRSWAATDWFRSHANFYSSRYQSEPSGPSVLNGGDFFLMDLRYQDNIPDHARVVLGIGEVQFGDGKGTQALLASQHCNDRWRVKWDYLIGGITTYSFRVIY